VAKAIPIRRQEETAATRSLLNAGQLMEDNPLLLHLKGAGGGPTARLMYGGPARVTQRDDRRQAARQTFHRADPVRGAGEVWLIGHDFGVAKNDPQCVLYSTGPSATLC